MEIMEYLRMIEIPVIKFVQDLFENHEELMKNVSIYTGPNHILSIILPVVASFNTELAARFFLTAAMAEWLNIIMKWMCMEDRPYWWIHETKIFGKKVPILKQTSITCETGPGFPSGHLMTAASAFLVLTVFLQNRFKKYSAIFSIAYVTILLSSFLSRIFVAAHFPHQCLFGLIIGLLLGCNVVFASTHNKINLSDWIGYSKKRMFFIATIMMFISLMTYWIQKASGIDPQWSVKLAFKWCQQPENIFVGTLPVFNVVCNTGLFYGMAVISPLNKQYKNLRLSPMVAIALTLFTYGLIKFAEEFIPVHSTFIFYSCHFILSSFKPIALLYIVPKFSSIPDKSKNN